MTRPRELVGRQQEVFRFIKLNPGVHLREIQRRLSIPSMGNLGYHIGILIRLNLIVEQNEGGYKRYYPVQGRVKNKKLLALLMQKLPRRVVTLILDRMLCGGCLEIGDTNDAVGKEKPDISSCGVTPVELMAELGLSSPALSYHLSKLYKMGVLRKEKQGKKVYYLVVDPEETIRLMVRHSPSFTDRLVNSIMAAWGV